MINEFFNSAYEAIVKEDGKLDSLIEFKIWNKDDDKEIKNDVLKLQKERNCNWIPIL